jgi:hypothetical protein
MVAPLVVVRAAQTVGAHSVITRKTAASRINFFLMVCLISPFLLKMFY